MTSNNQLVETNDVLLDHFPKNGDLGIPADLKNPAIRLYGRRFYKDQTPVEYLAEFLLVFSSPKGDNKMDAFSLSMQPGSRSSIYWPQDRIALKLFSFFPSSKLDTRHPVHQEEYLKSLEDIRARISGSSEEKEQAVRLLQSLFLGFVGVAKTRTWVTHSFLPASTSLLAREVTWNHPDATKNSVTDWNDSTNYFDNSTHNFFGRGGELLFLQLANLFSSDEWPCRRDMLAQNFYGHLLTLHLPELRARVESGLQAILAEAIGPVGGLVNFIESTLNTYKLKSPEKSTKLGWVPSVTIPEAFLFAAEIDNICRSTLGSLEKLEVLQLLCVMHVLRSLCFQARRIDEHEKNTDGFIGNYVWIISNSESVRESPMRKIAQNSFERIDEMLYRALRSPRLGINGSIALAKDLANGDNNCLHHFRKFGKSIGLVIPRTGKGQRFVLPPSLLRFLVAALVVPGERVRLSVFYARVFAHYGIALGDRQLAVALRWSGSESGARDYAVSADTVWIEEVLKQGGFLVELSDAVSIVHNPGGVTAEEG
jgi:hypothetical protein